MRSAPSLDYDPVATIARPLQERMAAASTSRVATPQYSTISFLALGERRITSYPIEDAPSSSHSKRRRTHPPRDATVMEEWLSEWDTAPSDPLPSDIKPLDLLCEANWIDFDLYKHSQKANEVWLHHYCPDMVPEASARQVLEYDEEQRRCLEQTEYAVRETERAQSRLEVKRAARRKNVDLIDMTEDDAPERTNIPITYGEYKARQASLTLKREEQRLRRRVPHLYDSSSRSSNPPQAQGPPVHDMPQYQMAPEYSLNLLSPMGRHDEKLLPRPQYRYNQSYGTFFDKMTGEHAIGSRNESFADRLSREHAIGSRSESFTDRMTREHAMEHAIGSRSEAYGYRPNYHEHLQLILNPVQ
jgi:hypothetical protein